MKCVNEPRAIPPITLQLQIEPSIPLTNTDREDICRVFRTLAKNLDVYGYVRSEMYEAQRVYVPRQVPTS